MNRLLRIGSLSVVSFPEVCLEHKNIEIHARFMLRLCRVAGCEFCGANQDQRILFYSTLVDTVDSSEFLRLCRWFECEE